MDHQVNTLRRRLLLGLLGCAGVASVSWALGGCGGGSRSSRSLLELGPLSAPDVNGVMLPAGFSSRIVARSGVPPMVDAPPWHPAPDGGATFPTADGGWIYVSNSEMDSARGGASALRFDAAARVVDSYPILAGTTRNCAGGATPWGTWLSCEEYANGFVWECDPTGSITARACPALGVFTHEAVAVDFARGTLYLTEDRSNGRLYRFVSSRLVGNRLDLDFGRLDVMQLLGDGSVEWHPIPDPSATTAELRHQVPQSTPFYGGEGVGYVSGRVFFATKGDNRIWDLDVVQQRCTVIYDPLTAPSAVLTGVDNVAVAPTGELVVAEDGGDMQLIALDGEGRVVPVLQLAGHPNSEIAGPAFDPRGTRLYFSSQRGTTGSVGGGMTFEIRGRFV